MAACLLVLLTLTGCSGGVLDPKGPIGEQEHQILFDAVAIMLVVVVPTIVAALAFAWWFRDSNQRAGYRPDFVYSGKLELVIWGIPLLVIMFLGGVIWLGAHQLDPFRPIEADTTPLEVEVVSLDWKWLFIYPDQDIASVNNLVVPVGTPLHFKLTSSAVMNSFFVPQLGSMIATMSGMGTQLFLKADHPGAYLGESTQFSGDGFSDMRFSVRAVPPGAFSDWLSATKQSGPALDRAAYTDLAQQSRNVRPFTYRTVDPGLFDAIIRLQVPAGPGPRSDPDHPGARPIGG